MDNLPKDPIMLLSMVNTNLRDYYKSLDDFCDAKDVEKDELIKKLEAIDYKYSKDANQFI